MCDRPSFFVGCLTQTTNYDRPRHLLMLNPKLLALLIQMAPLQPKRPRRVSHLISVPLQLSQDHFPLVRIHAFG
jgi:hypothetical protein